LENDLTAVWLSKVMLYLSEKNILDEFPLKIFCKAAWVC